MKKRMLATILAVTTIAMSGLGGTTAMAESSLEQQYADQYVDEYYAQQQGYTLDAWAQENWVYERYTKKDGSTGYRAARIYKGTMADALGNIYNAWLQVIAEENIIGFRVSIDGENFICPGEDMAVQLAAEQSSCLTADIDTVMRTNGIFGVAGDAANFFFIDLRMLCGEVKLQINMDLGTAIGGNAENYVFNFSLDHNDDVFRNIYDQYIHTSQGERK